jgi:hypothetical protein
MRVERHPAAFADSQVISAFQLLKSLNPQMQVLTEVMLPHSMAFLTPTPPRADALDSRPHLLAPAYICGSGETIAVWAGHEAWLYLAVC